MSLMQQNSHATFRQWHHLVRVSLRGPQSPLLSHANLPWIREGRRGEDGQGLRRDEGNEGGDDPPNPIIFLFCSRNFPLFLDSAAVPSSLIHSPQTATATMNDDDAGSHMQLGWKNVPLPARPSSPHSHSNAANTPQSFFI